MIELWVVSKFFVTVIVAVIAFLMLNKTIEAAIGDETTSIFLATIASLFVAYIVFISLKGLIITSILSIGVVIYILGFGFVLLLIKSFLLKKVS